MILPYQEIGRRVRDDGLIEPTPKPSQFQPAQFDLRLGGEFYFEPTQTFEEYDVGEEVTLKPHEFAIGHSIDTINMPEDLLGLLAGRSTVARDGVAVHLSAGVLDPGWSGQLDFEFFNFSSTPTTYEVGDRIAQIVFIELSERTMLPYGQKDDVNYQDQVGVVLPPS